jgi:hypothetical protein
VEGPAGDASRRLLSIAVIKADRVVVVMCQHPKVIVAIIIIIIIAGASYRSLAQKRQMQGE